MNGGYMGKLLYVNLTENRTREIGLPESFARKYLGGKGFGAKLLYDLVDEDVDAFSPENVLMFLTGPLTGTAVPAMRAVVVTKSPLTGTINDSYFGGHFGQELKYAGYDGLIIQGKSQTPVYLYLDAENRKLLDARKLWGLDIFETNKIIKNKLYDKRAKVACIGPAGENMVKFACIDCDPHRQAGRGGTGAVMGCKNLKAIVIKGNSLVPVADPNEFMKLLDKTHNSFPEEGNNLTDSGTPGNLDFANSQGFFPNNNYQDGVVEGADDEIGARAQRDIFWLKDWGCSGCIIRCGKIGKLRNGKYIGTTGDTTEYETLGLIGGNLGLKKIDAITYIANLCDRYGMDTISTGGVIGFAIECFQKGILGTEDTDGLELEFGSEKEIIQLVKNIAKRKGIGDLLAEGVKLASLEIGQDARNYAIEVKGLEVPAWTPRGTNSMALAYMTNDRGACHMRAFGIGTELENGEYPGGQIEHLNPEGIGGFVAWLQNQTSACWSVVQCAFGTDLIDEDLVLKYIKAVTGMELTKEEFATIGERVWNITRLFNLRENFTREDDDLPKRFKEEPLPSGPSKGHKITQKDREIMLDEYYEARGWDKNGVPTIEKLSLLGLDNIENEDKLF